MSDRDRQLAAMVNLELRHLAQAAGLDPDAVEDYVGSGRSRYAFEAPEEGTELRVIDRETGEEALDFNRPAEVLAYWNTDPKLARLRSSRPAPSSRQDGPAAQGTPSRWGDHYGETTFDGQTAAELIDSGLRKGEYEGKPLDVTAELQKGPEPEPSRRPTGKDSAMDLFESGIAKGELGP